jgi:BolA family transcriptional regulator, general stress-responsive regulator
MSTAPASRLQRLESRLRATLAPGHLEVVDDSHLHAGHAGAADGRGHFTVNIVSEQFAGMPVVRRHRLVYEAVGDMMATDIHALSIKALAPGEGSLS